MIPGMISRFAVLLAFLAVVAAPGVSYANNIYVNVRTDFGVGCTLRGAIENHNAAGRPDPGCAAGSGNDIIYVHVSDLDVNAPLLPVINGILTIVHDFNISCANIRGNAYLTIAPGATVTLWGIGMQATITRRNDRRSVIINNGGNLTIKQFRNPCFFVNEHTRNTPDRGGIIYNENGGKVTIIGDNFVFSHAHAGGAIYANSGTVTVTGGTIFGDDDAYWGGAIFLEGSAALNIASNTFKFSSDQAETVGGAIYSNGAKVTIQSGTAGRAFGDYNFVNDRAGRGAAIYSNGGQLSIDGAEMNNNVATGDGGVVVVSNVLNPPATIARAYFHHNGAGGNGRAVYVTDGSILNVSASTFLGGGIYVDTRGTLNVINSTFFGRFDNPGVFVKSGSGTVVFSTLANSKVGTQSSLTLSNSILYDDVCSSYVTDLGYNLQFQSPSCPSSIPDQNPLLSRSLLANNGGPTPTIALQSGSPAINAIPYGDCIDQNGKQVTTDQRGYGRPAPGSSACDIGAFEFGAIPAP